MKKRIVTWMILAVMLVAAVPAALAVPAGQVEDYTVERTGSVITVTPPEGYAEKGFYKLFWKNETTGEILSDVFPVDTPSCQIETEEDAEYSFQLYYAKLRGKLPSAWKEEHPAADPAGPSVWKVLWIDVPTVDFRGYTTCMSEENYLASGEIARAFEALAEELTGGRVDIEITRMTLDTPVTELQYYPDRGYAVSPDDFDMKHYALRKYDSVFVFARFEHILRRYDGITMETENPREYPGYSFIPLPGDDITLYGGIDYLQDVCVHEWIHQLGYLYETYHLKIPDPDEPEKYGYSTAAEGGGLDHGLFRDILNMTAVSEDGRYIGVPADAWEYKPTHYAHRNLSALQQEKAPSGPAPREEKPEPAEAALPETDAAVSGAVDEETGKYTNPYMKLSFSGADWNYYTLENLPYRGSAAEIAEDDPDFIKNDDSVLTMFAASQTEPAAAYLTVNTSSVPYIRENGEEAYFLQMQKNYERWAEQWNCEEYSCELIERTVRGRTLSGIRFAYVSGGVRCWQEVLIWLEDDHLNSISTDSFMFDSSPDTLKRFSWAE